MARGYLLPEHGDRKVIRIEKLTVFGSMSSDFSDREDDLMSVGVAHQSLDEWVDERIERDESL
jgi:hypothetical protein